MRPPPPPGGTYSRVECTGFEVLKFFSNFFGSKVDVSDFPENFTRGTPWPKEFEVGRIFNLSAQNGR